MTTLSEIEREIEALGYGTPEYHEAMAFYCLTLARSQWRMAERARLKSRAQVLREFKESELIKKGKK
jgi:hypothetical protein